MMKYFLKLNVTAFVYGVILFVAEQLLLEIYRIHQLTGWSFLHIKIAETIAILLIGIGASIILYLLTRKWMKGRPANFWTLILWIPYFLLLTRMKVAVLPMTGGGDMPSPGNGFIAAGLLGVFLIYCFIMNFVCLRMVDDGNV